METDSERRALAYLAKDPLLHLNMTEAIRCGAAKLLRVTEKSVLLYSTAGRVCMASAADPAEAERLAGACKPQELYAVCRPFLADALTARFGLVKGMECRQAAYLGRAPLPEPQSPAFIRPLDERHLPFIRAHYNIVDSPGYLRGLLRAGGVLGAFVPGDPLPAGFIGMHAEGTIGMLQVLPQYRRRGIALALEVRMVNRFLARGKIPFAQIAVGNTASMCLQRKLGFSISDRSIFWLSEERPAETVDSGAPARYPDT